MGSTTIPISSTKLGKGELRGERRCVSSCLGAVAGSRVVSGGGEAYSVGMTLTGVITTARSWRALRLTSMAEDRGTPES